MIGSSDGKSIPRPLGTDTLMSDVDLPASRIRPANDRETAGIRGYRWVGLSEATGHRDLRKRALTRGAGDGNRTRTTSLEGWSSTIELHPHVPTVPQGAGVVGG